MAGEEVWLREEDVGLGRRKGLGEKGGGLGEGGEGLGRREGRLGRKEGAWGGGRGLGEEGGGAWGGGRELGEEGAWGGGGCLGEELGVLGRRRLKRSELYLGVRVCNMYMCTCCLQILHQRGNLGDSVLWVLH